MFIILQICVFCLFFVCDCNKCGFHFSVFARPFPILDHSFPPVVHYYVFPLATEIFDKTRRRSGVKGFTLVSSSLGLLFMEDKISQRVSFIIIRTICLAFSPATCVGYPTTTIVIYKVDRVCGLIKER